MHKSLSYLLLGAMLMGNATFWPIGLGQADEANKPEPKAQPASAIVESENNNSIPMIEIKDNARKIMSRGELAIKLVNSLELNLDGFRFFKAPDETDFFDDVPEDAACVKSVVVLGYNGVINTSDRAYRPSEPILREELAQMLGNLLHTKSNNYSKPTNLTVIKDLAKAESEFVKDINLVVTQDLMGLTKEGYFQPKDGVTEQELNTILEKLKKFIVIDDTDVSAKIITNKDGGREVEISWGEKPSSGYEIKIIDFKLEANTLIVNYQTQEPTPGSYNSTVIIEPKDSKPLPANYPAQINIELNKI